MHFCDFSPRLSASVCVLHPWMKGGLSAPSNNHCQAQKKCTKEIKQPKEMSQTQFQPVPPHKAKTYYKIGTNIIIIQFWWDTFCLMKPVNLYQPTTGFTSWSWFAPEFWSLAIWHKAATEIENSAILSGMCSCRLLIHLDRIYCLFQRALCVTCMLWNLDLKKMKWWVTWLP